MIRLRGQVAVCWGVGVGGLGGGCGGGGTLIV